MEKIYEISERLVDAVSSDIKRYLFLEIDWTQRLIGILGARGTGKTTLMLQFIKLSFTNDEALYVPLDRLTLWGKSLYHLADQFYKNGGSHLFLDEVHKYPNWALEIKSIHDDYPDLNVVFSGSSALQLHNASADLSRRAAIYYLHNLSFREFLTFKTGKEYSAFSIDGLLTNHKAIARKIIKDFHPLPLFKEYLKYGAYPFYFDNPKMFHNKLSTTVNVIIESDLQSLEYFTYHSVISMQKILALIAESVPFKPNISEISRKSGVARDILLRMITLLERAGLLITLKQDASPTGYLTKPQKIYLNNPSLMWALSINNEPQNGNVRETFFINQLKNKYNTTLPDKGDFLVNNKYTFEVGGTSKTNKQIAGIQNSYIAKDNIESGHLNTIPLWLFGFLY
ncbi:MAG: AAA family ATPase [Prolixibacteraceae bacterium]|jgi:predicted AAA+ superfamily ATPase|nr:AAA family ATPase [Prolixibacteraceae bacterium]